MNARVFIGSTMAAGLLGLGVLVGSVAGTGNVLAQTPSATTPSAAATATAAPTDPGTTTTTPPADAPGGIGFRGGRAGGHGGFGGDISGRGATADNATRQITSTGELIDLVEADLAYANDKMDTTDVQRWVDSANALLQKAESANSGSQYGQSVAYSGAARELAMIAYSNMANELTAEALPSNGQIRGPHRGIANSATAPTQAQASYVLANTYNRLVAQGVMVGSAAEAAPYLTEAQEAYSDAYDAYQAGNYESAVTFARLAGKLAGVASSVAGAPSAPANADTPVTVPSPNF
jgi:hypothetical protein